MAGRGCTIVIKVLGGSTGNGQTEDLSLPVALHSPLSVLKDQLESTVGIPVRDQVLILCDLTDPERNSDVLLFGRDFLPLRDCGIRNGSVLTLHALGMSAEQKQKMTQESLAAENSKAQAGEEVEIFTLDTAITAAQANHSYNGVIFDVACLGPYEVNVTSVCVAGMLNRVRIFARDKPWEEDKPTDRPSPHWWAHREGVSREGWTLVADKVCRPSWDKPVEIKLDTPIRILPHSARGFYCHSGLPDDLGIQYQSYQRHSVVAEDQYVAILPGLGHTGSEPFDEVHGWYRAFRGLAGSIRYTAKWKGWSPFNHSEFPPALKKGVKALLLCQNCRNPHAVAANTGEVARVSADVGSNVVTTGSRKLCFSDLPVYVVYNIMEFMHWDWFQEIEEDNNADRSDNNAQNSRERYPMGSRVLSQAAQLFGNNGGGAQGFLLSLLQQMSAPGQEHDDDFLVYMDDEHDDDDYYEEEEENDEDDDDDDGEDEDDDENNEEDNDDEGDDNEGDESSDDEDLMDDANDDDNFANIDSYENID